MEVIRSKIAEVIKSDISPTLVFCAIACLVALVFFLFLFRDIYLRWRSGSRERRVLRELRKRSRSKDSIQRQ
jgi:hypothetical protein